MDDLNFCPTCGKSLPSGTSYCPTCGARLNDPEVDRKEKVATEKAAGDRIMIAVVLLIISAALAIISGAYLYFRAEAFVDMIIRLVPDGTFSDSFADFMVGLIKASALLSIVGGAVSAISAALAYKRRVWVMTFILCIVSAAICNIILGLIALWMIYKARPAFTD
jgi:uncharacterized membrane-anchored protein